MSASTSVLSLFIHNVNLYGYGLQGSIVGSDATATTYSLKCGSQQSGIDYPGFSTAICSIPSSFVVTQGKTGVQWTTSGRWQDDLSSPVAFTSSSCAWGSNGAPAVGVATSTSTGLSCERTVQYASDPNATPATLGANGVLYAYPVTITGVGAAATAGTGASGAGQPLATPTAAAGSPAGGVPGGPAVSLGGAPALGVGSEVTAFGGLMACVAVLLGFL